MDATFAVGAVFGFVAFPVILAVVWSFIWMISRILDAVAGDN